MIEIPSRMEQTIRPQGPIVKEDERASKVGTVDGHKNLAIFPGRRVRTS